METERRLLSCGSGCVGADTFSSVKWVDTSGYFTELLMDGVNETAVQYIRSPLRGGLSRDAEKSLGQECRQEAHLRLGLASVPGLEDRVHFSVFILCLLSTPFPIQDAPQSQVYEWDLGMHVKFN